MAAPEPSPANAADTRVRSVAWYVGVALAAVLLVVAILGRSLPVTVALVALVWALQRNAGLAKLPRVYRERGITPEMLTGRGFGRRDGAPARH